MQQFKMNNGYVVMKNPYFRFLVWSLFLLVVIACFSGCATTKTTKTTKSLLSSAAIGNVEAVRSALEEGADVNAKSKYESTPLHYAALGGYKNIAQLLLNNGADINEKSNNGSTPLHYAARTDHEIFTLFLLVNGADVHAKDDLGQTALHDAANGGSPRIVMSLIGVPYWAKRLHGGRVQIPTLQLLNEEEIFVAY